MIHSPCHLGDHILVVETKEQVVNIQGEKGINRVLRDHTAATLDMSIQGRLPGGYDV